jgi:hypothetical protein
VGQPVPPVVPAPEPETFPSPVGPIPQWLLIVLLSAVGFGVVAGMGVGLALVVFALDRIMAASRAHATEAPPAQPVPLTTNNLAPPQPLTPVAPLPLEQTLDDWGNRPLRLPRITSAKVIVPLLVLMIVGGASAYVLISSGLLGGGSAAQPTQQPAATPVGGVQPTAGRPTETPVPTDAPQSTRAAQPTTASVGTDINASLPPGDAGRGQQIFNSAQPLANGQPAGCNGCHTGGLPIAPDIQGVATRAESRKPGLSAEKYLHESIVQPDAFVVPDFNPIMPKDFGQRMSPQDLGDVIAYLMTLR